MKKKTVAADVPGPVLSDLQGAIMAHLQRDGRMPYRALADALGVTETTVYRQAQQLMDAGYFQVIGIVDPLRFGQGHTVLAGIGCEPTAARAVATALAERPEMRFVALVTGTFDVVCEVVTADRAHLTKVLIEVLPAVTGVRVLNTSWVLYTYLTHYLWDMPMHHRQAGPQIDSDHGPGARSRPAPPDTMAANGIQLDSIDHQIVALLQHNGRISYAEIAGALGLTESTARRRALRLLRSGYVRVVAVGNPVLLGYQDVVFIWFKVDLQQLATVVAALSRQVAIRYLSRTAGAVDLAAEAVFRDDAELFAFLNGPLAAISGIREVSISFELALYKRGYRRFDHAAHDEGSMPALSKG